jgi:hypothetical protein
VLREQVSILHQRVLAAVRSFVNRELAKRR